MFEITKYGPATVIGDESYKTLMPAFSGVLSDSEIIAVLSFIKNSWPEEERVWQNKVNGTQLDGLTGSQKKPTFLERLLK